MRRCSSLLNTSLTLQQTTPVISANPSHSSSGPSSLSELNSRVLLKSKIFTRIPTAMYSGDDSTCNHQKIDSEIFRSIFTPELKTLWDLAKRNDMEIRIAGGAVRDILLGIIPQDIDFATDALPERMAEIFTKEGIRMLEYGPRAISHGTISVRINDSVCPAKILFDIKQISIK